MCLGDQAAPGLVPDMAGPAEPLGQKEKRAVGLHLVKPHVQIRIVLVDGDFEPVAQQPAELSRCGRGIGDEGEADLELRSPALDQFRIIVIMDRLTVRYSG